MKIAVLGSGRMGSWLSRLLAQANQNLVAVYDCVPGQAQGLEKVHVLKNLAELISYQPELLLSCVTLSRTVEAFREASQFLAKNCILCDIASVKTGLPEYYKQCGYRYASLHPMFGPTFANTDTLKEQNAIIISESDDTAKEFFRKFFAELGLKLFEYSFAEHDHMMAYSLTVPFIASLVFAACVDKTTVPGTTFAKHRTIAAGLLAEDSHLLAEVLFNPHSIGQLQKIGSRLEHLKHIIQHRDLEELLKVLTTLQMNLK